MKSLKIFLPGALLLFFFSSAAQDKFTLSGYVRDTLSGETLIGATITIPSIGKNTVSNQYGFYSITLPAAEYYVVITSAGYEPLEDTISLFRNIQYNFDLQQRSMLEQVIVS